MAKKAVRLLLHALIPAMDVAIAIVAAFAAPLLKLVRRLGVHRFPVTKRILFRWGVFPLRDHYFEPLFNAEALRGRLGEVRDLPGLHLNEAGQLQFLERLAFSGELLDLALAQPTPNNGLFAIDNGAFEAGDAEILYQVVRTIKPRRMIEIGSGQSTRLAQVALKRNLQAEHVQARHVCIEPFEQPWLDGSEVELIRARVEDCDLGLFSELGPGDLLFIDSSHVIRPRGDVLFEYLQIIPRLASGVVVHVHDIFTPRDYPARWIVDEVRLWNEQYLVEALLANESRYEILLALNFLKHEHFEALAARAPYLHQAKEPGSLYFRVR